jgi:DNA-binding NarL/FixJ family response regulator
MSNANHKSITLVIVDNQKIFKRGLKGLLEKYPEIDVIGDANTCEKLMEILTIRQPDIILTGLGIADCDPVAMIKDVLKLHPGTKFIALGQPTELPMMINLVSAGMVGYLSKDDVEDEIYNAIAEVIKGNTFYTKEVMMQIFNQLGHRRKTRLHKHQNLFSSTEQEIIRCVCHEMTNKEIAEKLYLSVRTIEGHRLKILRKIDAKGTAGIVIYAIQQGIFKISWCVDEVKLPEK